MASNESRYSKWRGLFGVVISLVALAIVSFFFDVQQVIDALSQADWQALALALLVYGISYFPRARAWHLILLEEVPYSRVFLTMHVGYFLNNTLPFRLGELGRAFLLGRTGLGFWRVFSTILIERILDLAFATGLLIGTLPLVLESSYAPQSALYAGSIVLLGMMLLYFLALNRSWALSQYERWGARWPWMMRLGSNRLTAFLDGLAALTSVSRFLKVVLWLGFSWVMSVSVQFLILRAFLPSAQPLWAGFAVGVSSLGVAVPSSPGFVGVFEASLVGALALLGVSTSVAFAYALTTHFFYFLITGIIGGYGLSREGESLRNIYQAIKRIKP
ncbi:MAG: flippase-like domain-containing protein [Chloroflexi bacterium]|nr:flippase-like domain-containing protein [Chloroflexota bacterium]